MSPPHLLAVHSWALTFATRRTSTLYKPVRQHVDDHGWHMKSVYRAIPWPQPELSTTELEKYQFAWAKPEQVIATEEVFLRPGRKKLVHMACSLVEDTQPDDTVLLRSEILCAISLMRDHMKRRDHESRLLHLDYATFPVSPSTLHLATIARHPRRLVADQKTCRFLSTLSQAARCVYCNAITIKSINGSMFARHLTYTSRADTILPTSN